MGGLFTSILFVDENVVVLIKFNVDFFSLENSYILFCMLVYSSRICHLLALSSVCDGACA